MQIIIPSLFWLPGLTTSSLGNKWSLLNSFRKNQSFSLTSVAVYVLCLSSAGWKLHLCVHTCTFTSRSFSSAPTFKGSKHNSMQTPPGISRLQRAVLTSSLQMVACSHNKRLCLISLFQRWGSEAINMQCAFLCGKGSVKPQQTGTDNSVWRQLLLKQRQVAAWGL